MATEARRGARLGWFVPFMQAWGDADEATQAQIESAVQSRALGLITAETLSERVAALLGLTLPASR
jgi:hypothetical protein